MERVSCKLMTTDNEHFHCLRMVSCRVMTTEMMMIENEHINFVKMVSCKVMTIENDDDRK